MVKIQLNGNGLIPAIVQNATTGRVIMLGYMNSGSIKRTLQTGEVWFYSRSRSSLWRKGEVSGNYMNLKSVSVDCDGDTLLLQVEPEGPSCHTGNETCFFTSVDDIPNFQNTETGPGILEETFAVIKDREDEMPEDSYTASLFENGINQISQKVIEEAGEVAIAGVSGDNDQVVREVADLVYHTLVLLAATKVKPDEVWKELRNRRK